MAALRVVVTTERRGEEGEDRLQEPRGDFRRGSGRLLEASGDSRRLQESSGEALGYKSTLYSDRY